MALVLIEEVLVGLEEAKDSLELAVNTLADMTEDLHPDLSSNLKDILEQDFLRPLQSRAERLDSLLDEISTFASG
jgi:chaperonin cofactor prefoldin